MPIAVWSVDAADLGSLALPVASIEAGAVSRRLSEARAVPVGHCARGRSVFNSSMTGSELVGSVLSESVLLALPSDVAFVPVVDSLTGMLLKAILLFESMVVILFC